MSFSLEEINNILGFENFKNQQDKTLNFDSVSIDSRNILPNDLFIAIRGNKFDGHDFISEVIKKGVRAVIINQDMEKFIPENYQYWKVPDTLNAFQKIALFKRKRLRIPVVAITGSVGKTTTKEMTGEVIRNNLGKVKISEKNNNNEIGVGLTILETKIEDKILILEMGMRGKGQIENLSKYSEPDIAVITNIGNSHIGLLGSRDNIAKAKCEIVKYLNPRGVVIIPNNDALLESYLKEEWNGKVLKIMVVRSEKDKNLTLKTKNLLIGIYYENSNLINIDNKFFKISYKGIHNAYNFLFAYAISKQFDIKFNKFNVFNFKSINGRNKIIKKNKVTILDETYNASPESVKACIDVLLKYPGKHFLILGSMKELGPMSTKYHLEILNLIDRVDIEFCIFVCESNEEILIRKNFTSKKVIFKNDKKDIGKIMNSKTRQNDHVLIKGSRFWRLEEIIPLIK
tara:strand:- start:15242 stop:16615 length:1374 start_codon:yes stop_codon:yes gene_type:complete